MEWLLNHWMDVLTAVTYIVTGASIIARLTDSIWDDKIVAAILRVLSLAPKNPSSGKLQ